MRGSGAGREMAVPRMPTKAGGAGAASGAFFIVAAGSSRGGRTVKPGLSGRVACGFGLQVGSAEMAAREGRWICVAETGVSPESPQVCKVRLSGTIGVLHASRPAGSLDSMVFTGFSSYSFSGGWEAIHCTNRSLWEKRDDFPSQPHVCWWERVWKGVLFSLWARGWFCCIGRFGT